MTPVWLRPAAETDFVERAIYYADHGGVDIASRFFASAIKVLQALERMPGTGSPRIGELCNVPGLRVRQVVGFPCGWCYFVRPDHLDVVRLLADAQDVPAILTAFEP